MSLRRTTSNSDPFVYFALFISHFLHRNTRKSIRSNDRSIVQSVEVHSDGVFQDLNVAECSGNVDCSVSASPSAESDEDSTATSVSAEQIDRAKTPQQTNETIPIVEAENTPVTSAQSSDHQVENECVELHNDDAEELNEARETASNDHVPADQTSSLSISRATINRRRTTMDLNS